MQGKHSVHGILPFLHRYGGCVQSHAILVLSDLFPTVWLPGITVIAQPTVVHEQTTVLRSYIYLHTRVPGNLIVQYNSRFATSTSLHVLRPTLLFRQIFSPSFASTVFTRACSVLRLLIISLLQVPASFGTIAEYPASLLPYYDSGSTITLTAIQNRQ